MHEIPKTETWVDDVTGDRMEFFRWREGEPMNEAGECERDACREHSPERKDNDCCGIVGQTWCAPGYVQT